MDQQLANRRRHSADRVARGLCRRCHRPARLGRKRCAVCIAADAACKREQRQRRKYQPVVMRAPRRRSADPVRYRVYLPPPGAIAQQFFGRVIPALR